MSCENNVCGTGGWKGPVAGDPDNNITIHANTVYGGILVNWSYPLLNAFAVAYTDVYRSPNEDFSNAILLTHAGGASYMDPVKATVDTNYFYWIEVVSIHGTRGERIGPAMATARPLPQQTLESLTGLIEEGILAEALRQYIGGITLNNQAIYKEIQDRLAANTEFQKALADVQNGLVDSMTFIQTEVTQRKSVDSAFVDQLNIIAAAVGDAMAAILEEKTARIAQGNVFIQDYQALYGRIGAAEGAITDIKTLNIDPSTALATMLTQLATNVANAAAAVVSLDTALANGTHSLAQHVTTVETTLYGNSATGQLGLKTEIDQATGKFNAIFTAMTLVNGLAGGFGIANDGSVVEAGFDVDRFWVGRTSAEKIKPFIIDNGVVYIDKARIGEAWIGTSNLEQNSVTVSGTMGGSGGQFFQRSTGEYTYASMNLNLKTAGVLCMIIQWSVLDAGYSPDSGDPQPYVKTFVNGSMVSMDRAPGKGLGRITQVLRVNASGNASISLVFGDDSYSGAWRLGDWAVLAMGSLR